MMEGRSTFRIGTSTNQPSILCIHGSYSFMKCLYLSLQCDILILPVIVYPCQILHEIMRRRHPKAVRGRFSWEDTHPRGEKGSCGVPATKRPYEPFSIAATTVSHVPRSTPARCWGAPA